jgi:uncharacterized protein YbbK (DUF523 family)
VILISACLVGESCRYDAGHNRVDGLAKLLALGKAIAVCPEVAGGLPVPREPSEIRVDTSGDTRVITSSGKDVTHAFKKGAEKALEEAAKWGITQAILKSHSPSCGYGRIPDGSFSGRLVDGNGIAAELLQRRGVRIFNEHNWEEILSNER